MMSWLTTPLLPLAALPTLLAQSERLAEIGRQFGGENSSGAGGPVILLWLVLAGLTVTAGWLLYHLLGTLATRPAHNPDRLFRDLCRAHELDASSRRLLAQLAAWHRLDQPAQLFVDVQWFEPSALSPELQPQAARLQSLRAKLFGCDSF